MTGPIEQSSARVKLFGARNSPPAYSIRDFLQRSIVAFEWIELQNDEEARSLGHVDNRRVAGSSAAGRSDDDKSRGAHGGVGPKTGGKAFGPTSVQFERLVAPRVSA